MPNSPEKSQSQYPATPGQDICSLSKNLKLNSLASTWEASTPASPNKTSTRKASTSLNIYSSDSEEDESSQTNSKTIERKVEEQIKDYTADVKNTTKDIKWKINSGDWSLSA